MSVEAVPLFGGPCDGLKIELEFPSPTGACTIQATGDLIGAGHMAIYAIAPCSCGCARPFGAFVRVEPLPVSTIPRG